MENEKIAKEKLVLNRDHGSLNVVAVFDVIGIIATIIEIIVLLLNDELICKLLLFSKLLLKISLLFLF